MSYKSIEKSQIFWRDVEVNGKKFRAVAEFNEGYSHIVMDDNCWCVLNGGKPTNHIFPEAMEVLHCLPPNPGDLRDKAEERCR